MQVAPVRFMEDGESSSSTTHKLMPGDGVDDEVLNLDIGILRSEVGRGRRGDKMSQDVGGGSLSKAL